MRALLITLALSSAAWAALPEAGAAESRIVTGTVRDVAAGIAGKPAAELKTDDGKTLILRGYDSDEDGELLRLGGMRVRAHVIDGDAGLPASGGYVRVVHYEILDVSGAGAPRIGVLAQLELDGKPRLIFVAEDGTAEILPAGWTKKMTKHVGSKMWMIGSKKGGSFSPSRHGILRPRTKAHGSEPRRATEEKPAQ